MGNSKKLTYSEELYRKLWGRPKKPIPGSLPDAVKKDRKEKRY